MVADQALAPLGVEPLAVEGDDARRLLAAMLERVQAERDDRRGVRMAEDAEDAAFLAQPVVVEIDAEGALPASELRSAVLARCAGGACAPAHHCFGAAAGAAGAGAGTFLLIRASSFCLSASTAVARRFGLLRRPAGAGAAAAAGLVVAARADFVGRLARSSARCRRAT